MSHQFPEDLRQRIDAQLETGDFATEDEVLREALSALEKRQRGLQELRRMVGEADDDILAGRVGEFDGEATKRQVRARLSQRGVSE